MSSPGSSSWSCRGLEQAAEETAELLEPVERLFVIGRGLELATARELSLKLLETCRIGAQPLTATDLVHGPVAAAGERFPVWAIAADDATLPTVREAVSRAAATGAPVVVTGAAAGEIAGATRRIPLPPAPLPLLGPRALDRPGPALRACARAGARPRPGQSGRADEGDARALGNEVRQPEQASRLLASLHDELQRRTLRELAEDPGLDAVQVAAPLGGVDRRDERVAHARVPRRRCSSS